MKASICNDEPCNMCGAACLTIEFYERAKRGEPMNTVVYLCRPCLEKWARKLGEAQQEAKPAEAQP